MKKKIELKEDILNNESMKLFMMISGYLLLVLVLYSIFQIVNFTSCLGLVQILSILVPIIIYLLNSKKTLKKVLPTILIYLFILLIVPFIYNKTYDLTVDGNSYHKTAIAFIKNGWNPMYESARSFQKENNNVVKIDKESRVDLWIEHYPKASWVLAATIYNMTGNIESGKAITFFLLVLLVIITYNCLRKIMDKKWSIIITALFALNPITLAQFFSYYVDGIMGILFLIEVLLLMLINPKEKINKLLWMALASNLAIFVNIKFTGLLCSGVVAAVYYFYWLIVNRKEKEFINIFKRITINFSIVFITAIFLVGANSYIKNTIDHINPLYPLIGKDKVDIITTMQPKSFGKKNSIEKFFISTFSKTENVGYGEKEPQIKYPIRIYRSEISELFAPDVRIGGFGPFFALMFILSLIYLIYNLYYFVKNEKENLKYIVLPFLALIISMVLIGEAWWARYVPHLYYLVVTSLLLGIYTNKYKKFALKTLYALGLIGLMTLNIGCFAFINYKNLITFREIEKDLKEFKEVKDLKLKLGTFDLYGYYYDLKDRNINYTVVKEIKEEDLRYKYSWRFEVVNYEGLHKTN